MKRYQRSGLKDKDADTIKKVLISAMEDEKYYLEPELTLTQLAKYTNVSTNNLSQVINEHLHSSFCYFVNSYRVKAFIDSISDIAEKRRQYFLSHFVAVSIQNRHLTPHLKNTQARHLLNF